MEIRFGIAERGLAQGQETLDVPLLEHVLVGIEIDREIEEVRYERDLLAVPGQASGLQQSVDKINQTYDNLGTALSS